MRDTYDREAQGRLYAFVAAAILCIAGCAPRSPIYKSDWHDNMQRAGYEGPVPMRLTDPRTKLKFTISNDSNSLYVTIRCSTSSTVAGIATRGFQLWIDTTGKKKRLVGIVCPIPLPNAYSSEDSRKNMNGHGNEGSRNGLDTGKTNRIRRIFAASTRRMHVSGFKDVPNGLLDMDNPYGIRLAISLDDSLALDYRAAVPLKLFFHSPLLPADTAKTFSLIFNFNVTRTVKNYGDGFMPMGFGFGGFGFGDPDLMMMDMGRGSGTSSQRESETIWVKVHLAIR